MEFKRLFTTQDIHPYDTVKWVISTAEIPGSGFKQENVEFPEFYSENAKNIIASKYFAGKIGSDDREYSLKQLIDRVVNTNVQWGFYQGYFEYTVEQAEKYGLIFYGYKNAIDFTLDKITYDKELYANLYTDFEQVRIYSDELKYMLLHQILAFNSPVFFNIGNPASKQQVAACFLQPIDDTMESIEDSYKAEMEIYRSGSGSGTNYSKLRSSKESISGGGKSSGPCSFMRVSDAGAGVTKSGGRARRSAQMKILNVDHGDIKEFIWQKKKEEDKAKALIAAGWNDRFDDINGAYGSVFFQNSNQSIGIYNSFINAVNKNEDWALIERKADHYYADEYDKRIEKITSQGLFVKNPNSDIWYLSLIYKSDKENEKLLDRQAYKVIEWVKAIDIWNDIAKCAWTSGDPGLLFLDVVNKYNTCSNDDDITTSNPCGEHLMLDGVSCNLGSLNLLKFYDGTKLNIELMLHANTILCVALDIWVNYAYYPTEFIHDKTLEYRSIGPGFGNLGALLMQMCLPYGSKEGRHIASAITALLTANGYNVSNKLAKKLGTFSKYQDNKSSMKKVLSIYLKNIDKDIDNNFAIFSMAEQIWKSIDFEVGFRNATVGCFAPMGTIGFLLDCETTGIEPVLFPTVYKKLVGGGNLIIDSPSIEIAKTKLGYKIGDEIKPEHKSIFATSLSMDNPISWQEHVLMTAAIQKYTSMGISKTINMPNLATVEDIKNAYMMAYNLECKGITIYRDGCKSSQPLNTTKEKNETINTSNNNLRIMENVQKITTPRAKLDDDAQALRHKFDIAGHEGYLHVGLYDNGEPGEIFITMSKQGSTISGLMDLLGISMSVGLQYGVPLEVYTSKFKNTKFEPAGITKNKFIRFTTSPGDYLAKWLENEFIEKDEDHLEVVEFPTESHQGNAIEPQTADGPPCTECGALTMRAGSCYSCPSCGSTTGCS